MQSITDIIAEASKALGGAPRMTPRFARWVLEPFFGFKIEDVSSFHYQHASFLYKNFQLFVNKNNAFSTQSGNSKRHPNGWLCFLAEGEVCITSNNRSIFLSASNNQRIFYQSNYGDHKTYHFNAVIIFFPVGAIDIDIFKANQNIRRNEMRGFNFFDLIKIAILDEDDFILERMLLGRRVGLKKYVQLPKLIDGINNKFKLKTAILDSSMSAASVSQLNISGFRFRDFISILKIVKYEEMKYDLSGNDLADRLGYSTHAKLRAFLEREKSLVQMLQQEKD